MIKLVYCITKKPELTQEEFAHYWKNVHGPLARRIPGLRKLVQSHTLARTSEIRPPDFDGMAELWFDDWEALLTARQSPEWKLISADEVNFIDQTRVAFFMTEEHQII